MKKTLAEKNLEMRENEFIDWLCERAEFCHPTFDQLQSLTSEYASGKLIILLRTGEQTKIQSI